METLIEQLRTILGTNFGLYFKAHSFHWNVEGPNFIQYHEFLGDFYDSVWQQTDEIAEKLRMLGVYAPVNLTRIHNLSDVEENDSILSDREMFMNLNESNDRYIVHLRAGIVAADDAQEPAISNFLQELLDKHQKHSWMLKSIIK
jgi:starvation-inducible DNA-binding protein